MSSTPTPGPWTAVQGQGAHHRDVYIRAGERVEGDWPAVARCCSSRVGSFATVQANGHLIAAAPDLLAACKAALQELATIDHACSLGMMETNPAVKQLRAAIAKAEGGAQ